MLLKHLIHCTFFFLVPLISFTQTGVDELRTQLEEGEVSDSVQIHILKELILTDPIDTNIVIYYKKLSYFSLKEKEFSVSIAYCDTAISYIPPVDSDKRLLIQERIAYIYQKMGETDRSIKIYLNILKEYENSGNKLASSKVNSTIGTVFKRLGEFDNAIFHLNESIKQAKEVNNIKTLSSSLMTLGNCYKKLEQFDNAESAYLESIKNANLIQSERLLAGNYNNLGSLHRIQGDYKAAMSYYQKAIKINERTGNKKWLSYNYNNLGVVYGNLGENQKSLKFYKKSLALKNELKDERGKLQTYLSISEVYASIGKYKQAYEFNLKGMTLKDSLLEVDRIQETMLLAAEFQTEKRETEITKLNIQNELNQEKIKASEDRVKMLAIGIFMLFLLIFIIWKSLQARKRTNEILELKNGQIHSKNRELDTKNKEITDSINYAKRFQLSILPSENEMSLFFKKHSVHYQPKDIVSGDFYKFYALSNDVSHIVTADCTGHGVPGAMVSLIGSSFITKAIKEEKIENPSDILNFINNEMPKAFESDEILINDGMDLSLVKIDKKKKQLTFSGANNNCWVINSSETFIDRIPSGSKHKVFESEQLTILELKGDRFGIGLTSSTSQFSQITIQTVENDRIVLFTDGYVDQFGGPKNKKFKSIQLRETFFKNRDKSPDELKIILQQTLKNWMGNSGQIDDICVFIADI